MILKCILDKISGQLVRFLILNHINQIGKLRFKNENGKNQLCHTLNGASFT